MLLLFQVWDKEKQRMITPWTNLEELAREVDLPIPMDVDGIYVGMDGTLALLDECGNYVFLDGRRFQIVWGDRPGNGARTVMPVPEKAETYAPLFPGGRLLKKVHVQP